MAKSIGTSNLKDPLHSVPNQFKKKIAEGILIKRVRNIKVLPRRGLIPVVYM
jgi:hypothetical protein